MISIRSFRGMLAAIVRACADACVAQFADRLLIEVATPAGFEPATFSLEGCCSIP
jgi:hypothetical protein